ncbi:hypothetical protein GCM10023258_24250 [Terrabacter aeriphilus]|uniref:Phosphotyrosine protein phosphatase I domain-containing protein n=1 Tax=Terrabacter aeriphilus TaxID=515662 RepID=A0ABP9JGH9_9MICO
MRTDTTAGGPDYDRIVEDLTYTYDGVVSKESVAQAVADARAALEPVSTIPTYLPILTARYATTQLTAAAQAEGRITKQVPELLTDDVVRAADVVITMGCGDACPILPGKRYEDWDVADPAGQPLETVRDIRDDIPGRVTRLLRDFGI